MATMFKENNVFDEALDRIRMLYDYHDDVIVSMSGGKDSTVLFNLALMVAKEKNRLPVKVFWLDQEAEWQATVDYMDKVMRMPEVKPYWFQVPFEFPNNLSTDSDFVLLWDEKEKAKWIHPQADIAIKESPIDVSGQDRNKAFYTLIRELPEYCTESDNCAVLVGMRVAESLNRKMTIMHSKAKFRGETWAQKKHGKIQVFWPIYDFTNDDVWTAIAKNHWEYNKVYDYMYRWGVQKQRMRVSALIHETAWHSIEMLQEFEPKTYNKFSERVPGTSTFNHGFDEGGIIPKKLPFMFRDWKEYRDYLLVNIIKPEYWEHFRNEWKNQTGDEWYREHVKEIIIGDTCGTINNNAKVRMIKDSRVGVNGVYHMKDVADFNKYMEEKNGN